MYLHATIISLLNVLIVFIAMGLVGRARGKYVVKAPATFGHPDFERAFRAHQNTLEQTVMFLPVLWIATTYGFEFSAMIAGYIWCTARLWYIVGYIKEADKRSTGFLISFLAFIALLGMSIWGVISQLI